MLLAKIEAGNNSKKIKKRNQKNTVSFASAQL